MNKALLLFSGGIDSTTVMYWALAREWDILALSIDHPSRPREEKKAAIQIVKRVGVELIEAQLPFLEGVKDLGISMNYDDFANSPGFGYIAMRNMIFYAVAGHYAEIHGVSHIMAGHTEEDARTYSDVSKEFFRFVEAVYAQSLMQSYISEKKELKIILPLVSLSELESIKLADELEVPFDITWSCWNDGQAPCLNCFACVQRETALSFLELSKTSN